MSKLFKWRRYVFLLLLYSYWSGSLDTLYIDFPHFNLDEVDCMSIYGHHKKHGYGYNEQVGGPGDTEPKSPGNFYFLLK